MKSTDLTPPSRVAFTLAWKKYLESGEVNGEVIKPSIAASWQRSQDARVNPFGKQCRHVLEYRELNQAQEKNADLLVMATPLMEYYYQIVKGAGVIFMLIDANGYILNTIGDPPVLTDAKKIHLMSGANWTEQAVGTNAIGTALAIREPINVIAIEHYCQFLHPWSCAAAPIFDATGTLTGVIDISGPARTFHGQTLGIAAAVANSITMKFLLRKMEQDLQVMDHRFARVCKYASDGIIEVNANGIITHANPVAGQFFHRDERRRAYFPIAQNSRNHASTARFQSHPLYRALTRTVPSSARMTSPLSFSTLAGFDAPA